MPTTWAEYDEKCSDSKQLLRLQGIMIRYQEAVSYTLIEKVRTMLISRMKKGDWINSTGYRGKAPRGGFFGNKMRRSRQKGCAKLSGIIAAQISS